jgi:hypothetical protein
MGMVLVDQIGYLGGLGLPTELLALLGSVPVASTEFFKGLKKVF